MLLAAMLLTFPALAASSPRTPAVNARWIASWGSAQMVPTGENALPDASAGNLTLRQVVRLSAGGTRLRVRFSNAFGTQPLVIGTASVARPAGLARLVRGSGRRLSFAGRPTVSIAPGAESYSDVMAMPVEAGGSLTISLYLPAAPVGQTGHPGSRATSFLIRGDHVIDENPGQAESSARWYSIADVEVEAGPAAATIVAIGDSITDGYGVTPDSDQRWTDTLAARLRAQPATRAIGVVNAGIGGNRVLLDGTGPNLLARFDRDVIARSGVKWAILLEGVNDLGVLTRDAPATPAAHAAIVTRIIQAYTEMVARAHAHGIKLIGGTIMPFGGNDYYHPGPQTEADRQAINAFIRNGGVFDAVIDLDALMRDPARPDRLAPTYDSGDHLHPSMAGYKAMGDAVPLALFAAPMDAAAAPTLALTFDDLPAHGPLPAGVTRLRVVKDIVAALKAAGIARPHGFMNAGFGTDDPESPRVLATWRQAGFPLGNHGYAHRNLGGLDTAAFAREVTDNEPPLARLMGTDDWRWFRYPFLAEGSAPVARDAARRVLHDRGYRIAAVTMDFGDYAWNDAYVRCMAKGDTAAIGGLEASFLDAARIGAMRSRAAAQAGHGRDIPYVLLMHVGAFDARMLPRLLTLYRQLGFGFVSLDEAQRDPVYRAANDLTLPGPSIDVTAASTMIARAPLPDATICA